MTATNIVEIEAKVRTQLGTAASNRLRNDGFIPAVVYKNTEHKNDTSRCIALSVPSKEIEHEYANGNFYTTVFKLKTDHKDTPEILVVPRSVDLHPVSDKILHLDFLPIEANKKVKVKIRMKFLNKEKSIGIKRGGYLNILHRVIECYCDPDKIVNYLEYDAEKMRIHDCIKLKDLDFPEGVMPVSDNQELIIANIIGKRGKDFSTGEDAAKTAQVAEAAAPAAAPAGTKAAAPAKEEKKADK